MAGLENEVSGVRALAEASILISLAFAGTILAGFLLTLWVRLPLLFPPPWNLLGLPVDIAGGASLVYCGAFLSRHGRGTPYPRLPPKRLVTTGPFARVRNPIIVSWGVLLVGIGIVLNWTGLLLLMVPAFVIIHAYLLYREEPILRSRFPAEYDAYRFRVPRWIPRLRK
jgi:protein-S-isoprenylcysteine O-methyltransferase Ste14